MSDSPVDVAGNGTGYGDGCGDGDGYGSSELTGISTTTETIMEKKTKKNELQYVILGNNSYGLYCGELENFDPISGVAVVRGCRHIARWYGKTGGITSLAAHGICGPQGAESRIGAPVDATLTGIVNVFVCSDEARASLENSVQQ